MGGGGKTSVNSQSSVNHENRNLQYIPLIIEVQIQLRVRALALHVRIHDIVITITDSIMLRDFHAE